MGEMPAAFDPAAVERKGVQPVCRQFDMKTPGEFWALNIVVRVLPVMEEQASGRTFIDLFFITLDNPTFQDKSKIGVLVIMPINFLMGIFGIRQGETAEAEGPVGLAEKIACC